MTPNTIAGRDRGVADTPQLYETPTEAVLAMLCADPYFNKQRKLWEPCCGPGSMVRALEFHGHIVFASDIEDYSLRYNGRAVPAWRQDFFSTIRRRVDAIFSNPPFSRAAEFAALALTRAPRVYLLLELGFMQGGGTTATSCPYRDSLIDGGQLTGVFPFRERINDMNRDGFKGKIASTSRRHAWFRWEAGARVPHAKLSRISLRPENWEKPCYVSP